MQPWDSDYLSFLRTIKRLSVKNELDAIATRYGTSLREIHGRSRSKHVARARHEAIHHVASRYPAMSLPALGRIFRRDHTTILYSLRKAIEALQTNFSLTNSLPIGNTEPPCAANTVSAAE